MDELLYLSDAEISTDFSIIVVEALAKERNKRGFRSCRVLMVVQICTLNHKSLQNNSYCSIAHCEINPDTVEQQPPRNHHVPKLMVSNVMSLTPKIDEVQKFFL